MIVEESFPVLSGSLRLEARLAYPDRARPSRAALLFPPHPFLGGDMDGNVLRALGETIARDAAVIRFNYRGIGKSQTDRALEPYLEAFWRDSTCPDYEDAIFEDAEAAALAAADALPAGCRLDYVGYSFGCLPLLSLAARGRASGRLALVSPPIAKWKIAAAYRSTPQPKAFFFSAGDFACPEDAMTREYEEFSGPKELRRFDGCDHFFVGKERELAAAVAAFLS